MYLHCDHLMDYHNVVDFDTAWAKKKALEFTTIYVSKGKSAAANFSSTNIPPFKRALVKVFILEEFKRRGIEL